MPDYYVAVFEYQLLNWMYNYYLSYSHFMTILTINVKGKRLFSSLSESVIVDNPQGMWSDWQCLINRQREVTCG